MKKAPYMAYPELQQLMWLSAAVQMMDELLTNTTIPEWVRKFKTVRTYLHNIIEERQNALDPKELKRYLGGQRIPVLKFTPMMIFVSTETISDVKLLLYLKIC